MDIDDTERLEKRASVLVDELAGRTGGGWRIGFNAGHALAYEWRDGRPTNLIKADTWAELIAELRVRLADLGWDGGTD